MSTKKVKMISIVSKEPGQPAQLESMGVSLEAMQARLGGYVEATGDDALPGITIWLDEEGKLKGKAANLSLFGGADLAVGTVLFTRTDAEGEVASLRKADAAKILKWCASHAI